MTKKILKVRFAGLLMILGLALTGVLGAQETGQSLSKAAASLLPESLPGFLKERNDKLAQEIASLQEKIESGRLFLHQVAREQEELRTKIAALNASMALKELNAAQAREEIAVLNKKQAAVAAQIKALENKPEALNKELQEKAEALKVLQREIATLRKAKHPVARSREMKAAYQTYRNLTNEFNQKGAHYKEILENTLAILQTEQNLLSETIARIQSDYLEKTVKEELLKRQPLRQRIEQLDNVLKTLAALPGKARAWLTHAAQSGRLAALIEKNWATLTGLLLFLLLLGLGTHKFKGVLLPRLADWQKQMPDRGLTALLGFARILVSHLFSVGFAAWLYVCLWTLGIKETGAAWLTFHGVVVLVALRLMLKMLQILFAGESRGGILPIDDHLAGYYRRHFKALTVYFLVAGVFFIPNAQELGFSPEGAGLFRHLFQVALLGWALWLMRRRYLDRVLAQLPVSSFLQRRGFLPAVRSAVFLVLAFVTVSSLLGFRLLSDYVAKGASFTLAVLALSWILGEGAYAILRLALHPEVGFLAKRYPEKKETLSRLYRLLLRLTITALMAVAGLVALKFWGVETRHLNRVLQWLSWGPAFGPIRLSPVNIGFTILVIYLGFWVSRAIRTFLELKFYPSLDWDRGIRYTISMTIHYVILVITAVIALNTLGISVTSLALVAGGLGVGVGFGLQSIVSNFISGLILLFERPIKVGDMLVIDGQWGTVREIRVRSTIFQTFDRYFLIIPNSELLSSKILNWTYLGWGTNRLTLKVGVSYGSDPRQVTKIIEEVCRANPRVIHDPPPQIFFEAYGDNSLNFNIWVHLGSPSDRIAATHELNSAIFEAFRAHGIEIPFPQRDLHIRSWSPEASPPLSTLTKKE